MKSLDGFETNEKKRESKPESEENYTSANPSEADKASNPNDKKASQNDKNP